MSVPGSALDAGDAVVVAVGAAGLEPRVGLAVEAGHQAADHPAVDRAHHVGELLGGVAERAVVVDDGEHLAA